MNVGRPGTPGLRVEGDGGPNSNGVQRAACMKWGFVGRKQEGRPESSQPRARQSRSICGWTFPASPLLSTPKAPQESGWGQERPTGERAVDTEDDGRQWAATGAELTGGVWSWPHAGTLRDQQYLG